MSEAHPQFSIFNKLSRRVERVSNTPFEPGQQRHAIEEMFESAFAYLAITTQSGLEIIPNPQIFRVRVELEVERRTAQLRQPRRFNKNLEGQPLYSYHLSSDGTPKTLLLMGDQATQDGTEFNILKVVYNPSAPEPKWP